MGRPISSKCSKVFMALQEAKYVISSTSTSSCWDDMKHAHLIDVEGVGLYRDTGRHLRRASSSLKEGAKDLIAKSNHQQEGARGGSSSAVKTPISIPGLCISCSK